MNTIAYPAERSSHVKRLDVIKQAETALTVEGKHVLILYGLSGSGKTQIAHSLCRGRITSSSTPAYVVDASSPESLHSSFSTFAIAAKLVKPNEVLDRESLRATVQTFLLSIKQDWTLVFDGCVDGVFIKPWILSEYTGLIIITSQPNIDNLEASTSISVQQLTSRECVAVFCAHAKIGGSTLTDREKELIEHVSCDLMGSLAIAVAQAGAYVSQICAHREELAAVVVDYVDEFSHHRDGLLEEIDSTVVDEYQKSLLTTFDMALESITKKNQAAINLLRLLCCFHYRSVQLYWFENVAKQFERTELSGMERNARQYDWLRRMFKPDAVTRKWSKLQFTRAIETLEAYGLISVQSATIEIHPLIHSSAGIKLVSLSMTERNHILRSAVGFLCEIYIIDNIKGYDSEAGARLRIELYPHVANCLWVVTWKTTLWGEENEDTDVLSAYSFNRFADYLNTPLLASATFNSDGVIIPLRIAAFAYGVRQEQLSSRHALNGLRKLMLWMSEIGCLSYATLLELYDLVRVLIDTSALLDPGAINTTEEHSEILYEQMVAAGNLHSRKAACDLAVKALAVLETCKDKLTSAKFLHFRVYYHYTLCLCAEQRDDRLAYLQELEHIFSEVVTRHGHASKLAKHAYQGILSARRNDGVRSELDSIAIDAMYGDDASPGKESREAVIRNTIAWYQEQGQHFSSDVLELLTSSYECVLEAKGEWHLDTITEERSIYENRVYNMSDSKQCPNVFGPWWPTRNDKIIIPIEVAIALRFLKEDARTEALWAGYLAHLNMHSKISDLIAPCAEALRAASTHVKTSKEHAAVLVAASTEAQAACEEKSREEQLTIRSVSAARDLFQLFTNLEESLERSSAIEAQSSAILHFLHSSTWCIETSLHLTIQYLLYLVYKPSNFSKQVFAKGPIEQINVMVTNNFSQHNVIAYDWKVFESIFYQQAGLSDTAEAAAETLIMSSVPNSIEAWHSRHDHGMIFRTIANKEIDSLWSGDRLVRMAAGRLERVQTQYLDRGWLPELANLQRRVVMTRVDILGFHTEEMIKSLRMAMYSFCQLSNYSKIWELLEEYGACISGDNIEHLRECISNITQLIVLDLPKYANFKAIILICSWLTNLLRKPGLSLKETDRLDLWCPYTYKTQERLAYAWLGYPITAKAAHAEAQELIADLEACFDTLEPDIANAYRSSMEKEEAFWLRACADGVPDRHSILKLSQSIVASQKDAGHEAGIV